MLPYMSASFEKKVLGSNGAEFSFLAVDTHHALAGLVLEQLDFGCCVKVARIPTKTTRTYRRGGCVTALGASLRSGTMSSLVKLPPNAESRSL